MVSFLQDDLAIVHRRDRPPMKFSLSSPELIIAEKQALVDCLRHKLETEFLIAQSKGLVPSDAELATLPLFQEALHQDAPFIQDLQANAAQREEARRIALEESKKAEQERQRRIKEAKEAQELRRREENERQREERRVAKQQAKALAAAEEQRRYEELHARWESLLADCTRAVEQSEQEHAAAAKRKEEIVQLIQETTQRKAELLQQLRTIARRTSAQEETISSVLGGSGSGALNIGTGIEAVQDQKVVEDRTRDEVQTQRKERDSLAKDRSITPYTEDDIHIHQHNKHSTHRDYHISGIRRDHYDDEEAGQFSRPNQSRHVNDISVPREDNNIVHRHPSSNSPPPPRQYGPSYRPHFARDDVGRPSQALGGRGPFRGRGPLGIRSHASYERGAQGGAWGHHHHQHGGRGRGDGGGEYHRSYSGNANSNYYYSGDGQGEDVRDNNARRDGNRHHTEQHGRGQGDGYRSFQSARPSMRRPSY